MSSCEDVEHAGLAEADLTAIGAKSDAKAVPLPKALTAGNEGRRSIATTIGKEADIVIPHPVPLVHLIIREVLNSICFQ